MAQPANRHLIAKIAVHESWSHTPDRAARTAPARAAALLARFEREVDPEGTLPPDERTRRAEHKHAAYLARLELDALKTARGRDLLAEGEAAAAELTALTGGGEVA
ncbi:hypothetical protein [Cellulomonas sp. P5_C5]